MPFAQTAAGRNRVGGGQLAVCGAVRRQRGRGNGKAARHALTVLKCANVDGIETVDTWEPLNSVLNERGIDALSTLYVMHGDKANYGNWGHMSSAGNDFVAQLLAERLRR